MKEVTWQRHRFLAKLTMSFCKRALRLRAPKLVRRDVDLAELGKTGARPTRHKLRTIMRRHYSVPELLAG